MITNIFWQWYATKHKNSCVHWWCILFNAVCTTKYPAGRVSFFLPLPNLSRKIEGDSAPRVTTKKTIEFKTVTHLPLDILPKIAFWCQSSCFLVTVWLQWAKTGIYKSNTSGTSVPHQCKILAILKFQHAQKQNFNIAFGFKSDTADLTYKWVSI